MKDSAQSLRWEKIIFIRISLNLAIYWFSLESDDRMLPPKLVGYAPEIIGVANTNAIVIVRSQERIISETAVPPGPFRIQTLIVGSVVY